MEDEEEEMLMRRSNTDCGLECEYRHSEMARLNPRDCWYWKHGNCLNPACGFQHPPLDVNNEVVVGAASFSHFSSVTPSKHNVPCYFYYSGYCNKGDRCTFLHDPDSSSSVKTKLNQETTDAPPASDAKTTVKTEPSLLPSKKDANPSDNSLKINNEKMAEPKDCAGPDGDAPQSATTDTIKADVLKQTAVDEYDVGVTELDSLSPSENLGETHEYFLADQIKQEEWSEPSLVDGRSDGLASVGDDSYLEDLEENHDDLECEDMEYGYEDQMDADGKNLLDETRLECNAYSVDELQLDIAEFSPPYMPHEKKFLTMELPAAELSGVDLRHRLRNRRIHDHHLEMHASTRRNLPNLRARRSERLLKFGPPWQFYRRLASELERNGVASPAWRNGAPISANRRRWSTYPWLDRYNYRRSLEIASKRSAYNFSTRPFLKQKIHGEDSFFTGPKGLVPIKVESGKAAEDGYSSEKTRHSSRYIGSDFEGPKPLSELLREKNRAVSVGTLDVEHS
ncbi:Zinc finger CCCH domain-containing protein [Drosera capensis]